MAIYHFREYLPVNSQNWLLEFFAKGFYAVDLFFVLSGFVIQLNYSHLFTTMNKHSFREFAIARVARVYPLHVVIMIVFIFNPLAIAFFSRHGLSFEELVGGPYNPIDYILSLLLIQNWGFRDQLTWNVPAWSISTEFGAYIMFPIASYIASRCVRSHVTTILAISILLGSISIVFWDAGAINLGYDIPHLGLARCVFEFLTGMLLCNLYRMGGACTRQIPIIVGAAGLLSVTFISGIPDYVGVPLAFSVFIFGLTAAFGPLTYILSARPLVYLGTISYATYLCHFLIKDWIKFLIDEPNVPRWFIFSVFIVVTLLSSAILYATIEVPLRKAVRTMFDRGDRPLILQRG